MHAERLLGTQGTLGNRRPPHNVYTPRIALPDKEIRHIG